MKNEIYYLLTGDEWRYTISHSRTRWNWL